jgi:hypothetical protein
LCQGRRLHHVPPANRAPVAHTLTQPYAQRRCMCVRCTAKLLDAAGGAAAAAAAAPSAATRVALEAEVQAAAEVQR